MISLHDSGYKSFPEVFSDKHKMFYLVDVRVPHLGEEAEGRRRVRVVDRELYVSLQWQTQGESHLVRQAAKCDYV